MGRVTLGEVRDWLGDLRGGPGRVGGHTRGPGWVGGPTRRFGMIRGNLK